MEGALLPLLQVSDSCTISDNLTTTVLQQLSILLLKPQVSSGMCR